MNEFRAMISIRLLLTVILLFSLTAATANGSNDQDIDLESLRILDVAVGGTQTLQDVITRFGKTKIWHTGDAAESETKICYRIRTKDEESVVVFASNGEMASPAGQINAIRIIGPTADFSEPENCASLPIAINTLATSAGIRLGMTQEEVQSLYGTAHSTNDDMLNYSVCRKKYMHTTDPYFGHWVGKEECFEDPSHPYADDCGTLEIMFKDGRAVFIGLNRIQSVC